MDIILVLAWDFLTLFLEARLGGQSLLSQTDIVPLEKENLIWFYYCGEEISLLLSDDGLFRSFITGVYKMRSPPVFMLNFSFLCQDIGYLKVKHISSVIM